jgi:hypothetical protein
MRGRGLLTAACLAGCVMTAGVAGSAPAAPGRDADRTARGAIEIVQLTEDERAIPPAALSSEQAAVVLLETAERFEERGELMAARLLYREILERYGETVQATRARDRLAGIEGRPDFGTGLPPVSGQAEGSTETVTPPPLPPESSTTFERSRSGGLDQSGRVSVIVYSTVMAAWVALAVPIYAEAEGSPAYGLALLLGAPAGLVTSVYATRDRQVTAAQSDIYVLAGNMGLWHGLALGLIQDWEGHEVAGATALGGLFGTAAGALIVSPGKTRETAAALSSLAAPYGIWYGLMLSGMLRKDSSLDDDATLGAMLIGGDAALAGAVLSMKYVDLSRERARLIGLAGGAGALLGGAIDLLFKIEGREAWTMVAAGTTGGLFAGVALTSDYDTKRHFNDPPRGAVEESESGPDLALLPLHLRATRTAGPNTERWRESLKMMGLGNSPTVGVTLLEARF